MKSALQTYEAALAAGIAKACRPLCGLDMALRSMGAGAFIAFGGLLSIVVGFGFPEATVGNPSLQRVLSGLAFPIGLLLVVTQGAELFTGNNALLIPPALAQRITPWRVAGNWTAVWIGNFIGALLLTTVLVWLTGTLDGDPYRSAITTVAQTKASLPWSTAFWRGIGANWCVCLAVWLALSADSLPGKALGCWVPVAAFVILGYEHSIANMFFIPAGMMLGADVRVADLFGNLIPVTAGNIVGGASVGAVQWMLYRKNQ